LSSSLMSPGLTACFPSTLFGKSDKSLQLMVSAMSIDATTLGTELPEEFGAASLVLSFGLPSSSRVLMICWDM